MKVTLQVNGQEMTFSEKELISILEEHFKGKAATKNTKKFVKTPHNQYWFSVEPLSIDQTLFENERDDPEQERTRKLILEAFDMLKQNPKYGKPFGTRIPDKTWISKTIKELEVRARKLGDHNADWVEQVLEWAQRIYNGETWEDICNKLDIASYYRLVVWKNGDYRFIGGSEAYSEENGDAKSASYVGECSYDINASTEWAVPLVVAYGPDQSIN